MLTAWTMAAAIVLSAPFVQQAFSAIDARWPSQSERIILAATVIPASLALVAALWRIRESRWRRYALLALGLGIAWGYDRAMQPIFTEAFHFIQYGILSALFYRATRPAADLSMLAIPVLGCAITGSIDEWYQWFIPFRAGDVMDVAINVLAGVGGVLFAAGVWPQRIGPWQPASPRRVAAWAGVALVALAIFFHTIHMGHDVTDAEVGSFRSRFTRTELLAAATERAARWRDTPPVQQRRVSREDQYLTEGLWHVAQRNEAWDAGDVAAAWRENRILETFYGPVLAHPTYDAPRGHRWPDAQRADAQGRLASNPPSPIASDDYRHRLYTWADFF